MTQTPECLIEAAARAICFSQGQDPDAFDVAKICGLDNEPLPLWQFYAEQARAAASVIIEACAEEADEIAARILNRWLRLDRTDDLSYGEVAGAKMVTAAIRALAPVKEG